MVEILVTLSVFLFTRRQIVCFSLSCIFLFFFVPRCVKGDALCVYLRKYKIEKELLTMKHSFVRRRLIIRIVMYY